MGWLARLGLIMVGLLSLLVLGASQMGSISRSMTAAIYDPGDDEETFTLYVEDMDRHFRLHLAGTRCFSHIPRWAYPSQPEGSPTIGNTTGWITNDSAEFMKRLRCP